VSDPVPRGLWLAVAAASVGLLAALWVVDYLPTHDGPHHVFLGHLENHFDDPGTPYRTYMDHGHPFTALGFHVVFSALDAVLPWRTALRVTLSIIALTWAFGHLALCVALHPRRAVIGLMGFASGVPWALYMGFFSYALSWGLGLLVLAAAIAGWPWTPIRRAALAGALAIVAVAHAFGAELTGLALLALVLARGGERPRGRLREAALLALMGLPALAICATPRSTQLVPTEWLSIGRLFTSLPRMFLPGPLWRAWPPLLLGLAGIAAAIHRRRRGAPDLPVHDGGSAGSADSTGSASKPLARGTEIALIAVALACFVGCVALPLNFSQWELFSPRVLPPAVLLGSALLPVEDWSKRAQGALAAGLGAFTLLSLGVAVHTSVLLRASADDALSGLGQPLRRDGPRLCAALDSDAPALPDAPIPYFWPLQNMGALYTVEQGGLCPYVFAGSASLHSFVFTEEGKRKFPPAPDLPYFHDPRLADPAVRAEVLNAIAQTAGPFQDVIFHGWPADGDALVERGFVADFRRGGLFLGHFVPCPVRLEVEAPAEKGSKDLVVSIEYGFGRPRLGQFRALLEADRPGEPIQLDPSIALCGPAWIRAAAVPRGGQAGTARPRYCTGADPEGKIHVIARPGAVFSCRIGGP
jgi:hypothetical protein